MFTMEINQETKEAIANSVIAAAYHFSRGDDESVNYCKELLVEAVAALEEH
jgi:hypothetical protein